MATRQEAWSQDTLELKLDKKSEKSGGRPHEGYDAKRKARNRDRQAYRQRRAEERKRKR